MWSTRADARLTGALLLGLIALAWLAILLWGLSSQSGAGSHVTLEGADLHSYMPRATLFLGGWLLMTIAMMVPSSLPLVLLFQTIVRQRRERHLLTGLLLAGYLLVWLAFGALAHVADFGLHQLVESDPWLHRRTWLLTALPFLLAGAYQFTPLKHLCLDKCRSPYSFIVQHWRGSTPGLQALRLGFDHGAFCVGCCWSLMLLMFAVSAGNLIWMLGLAAYMTVEKNFSWGRQLSAPSGVVFLSAGITVLVLNVAGA